MDALARLMTVLIQIVLLFNYRYITFNIISICETIVVNVLQQLKQVSQNDVIKRFSANLGITLVKYVAQREKKINKKLLIDDLPN